MMLWDKGSLETDKARFRLPFCWGSLKMVWRGGGMACVVFNAWAMGNGRL